MYVEVDCVNVTYIVSVWPLCEEERRHCLNCACAVILARTRGNDAMAYKINVDVVML